jgi:hypothetical protein
VGLTFILNSSGIDKEQFEKYTKDKPATYQDKNQHWKPGLKAILSISGIDKEKFVKYTKDKLTTHQDWSRHGKQV